MKQKFKPFSFVKVCDNMPKHMRHFPCGFNAIVRGTYSQLYGGKDINSYSLYQIDEKTGKIVNLISWYKESQLTQIDSGISNALQMIEDYNFKERVK